MRTLVAALATAALTLAAAAPALADTIRVPGDYDTIGEAVANALDGDTVLVGKGTYPEEVTITDKSNLTIRGKGNPVLTPAGVAFTITNGSVVSISGFRVESGAGAVDATTTSGLTLSKIQVISPGNTSFAFTGCANVLVSKCTVFEATAVPIRDLSSSGLVIEKCTLILLSGNAMELSPDQGGTMGSNDSVVAKNRVTGGATAIRYGGTGGRIEKNTIVGGTSVGILFEGMTSVAGTLVSRNRVQTGGPSAIQCFGNNVTIERNGFDGGGINTQGSGIGIVRNTVLGSGDTSIATFGTANTVSRNQVLGSSSIGLDIYGGPHTVEGNRVTGCDSVGIYLHPGTEGSLLALNQVKACDSYGIIVYATPVSVTGNKSSLNGLEDYADSSAEGVNVLTDNKFGTTLFNYVD